MHPTRSLVSASRARLATLLAAAATVAIGCDASMKAIDRRAESTLLTAADDVGGGTLAPRVRTSDLYEGNPFPEDGPERYRPPTRNPAADDLRYDPRPPSDEDLETAAARIQAQGLPPEDAQRFDLRDALQFALDNAVSYLNAEENYIIAALQLIIEQHRWEPRPFNVTSASFTAAGNDGRFTRTLDVANDLGITQRLPYGGEVSARLVVDLTRRVDGMILDNAASQSASLILEADIPVLRGAGLSARENLIQTSRDLVYAARRFEEFRRDFCLSIIRDYLNLVVQQQEIANARRQVASSRQVDRRENALVEAGRQPPFQADLAKQNTLFAVNRLAGLEERYRIAVDAFKVRIGMDPTTPLVIVPVLLDLPLPEVAPAEAVRTALQYRLDLQTITDEVEDARRRVDVASNQLLPDLDVSLAGVISTIDRTGTLAGINLRPDDGVYSVSASFAAPLDRTIEKARLREAQIRYEQSIRDQRLARDDAAVEVRSALRGIELSRFSLQLQEQNVRIAMNREASIAAAPDRADARDRTEALDQRRQAEDQRDRAQADLQLSILGYLLATGQFRVSPQGLFIPIEGMTGFEVIGTLPIDRPGAAPDLGGMTPETGMETPEGPLGEPVGGEFPIEVERIEPPSEPAPAVEPVEVPPATPPATDPPPGR
ncbi:MAG: TolC family protein [Planctomycetota bacterium]|jgi:outer membrane protein TolC